MRKIKQSSGFTLIEAIVGFLIGSIVLVALWTIFSSSQRQRKMADTTLQGVKANLLFTQPLEQDIARLYIDSKHPIEINPEGKSGLRFHIFDDNASQLTKGKVRTKQITYLYAQEEYSIFRQEEQNPPRRMLGSFDDLRFSLQPTHDYVNQTPYVNEVQHEHLRAGGQLVYLVSSIPVELTKTPLELWKPQDRTIVWGSLALEPVNDRRLYHFCNSNATTKALTSEAELSS